MEKVNPPWTSQGATKTKTSLIVGAVMIQGDCHAPTTWLPSGSEPFRSTSSRPEFIEGRVEDRARNDSRFCHSEKRPRLRM